MAATPAATSKTGSVDQQTEVYKTYAAGHQLALVNVFTDRAKPGPPSSAAAGLKPSSNISASPKSHTTPSPILTGASSCESTQKKRAGL